MKHLISILDLLNTSQFEAVCLLLHFFDPEKDTRVSGKDNIIQAQGASKVIFVPRPSVPSFTFTLSNVAKIADFPLPSKHQYFFGLVNTRRNRKFLTFEFWDQFSAQVEGPYGGWVRGGEADKYILCMTIDQSYLPTHLPMYPLPPSLKTECFRSWLPTQMCGLDKYIFPTEEYTISIFESFSPPEGSRWTSVKTLTQLFLKMPTPIGQHIHCINRTAFIRAL